MSFKDTSTCLDGLGCASSPVDVSFLCDLPCVGVLGASGPKDLQQPAVHKSTMPSVRTARELSAGDHGSKQASVACPNLRHGCASYSTCYCRNIDDDMTHVATSLAPHNLSHLDCGEALHAMAAAQLPVGLCITVDCTYQSLQ